MDRTYSHTSPSVLDVRDPYSQFYQGSHHGKHWYLWHPDDIGTAKPMNENEWFKAFQPLLLKVVNTGYGRQLLGIDMNVPLIQHITKSAFHCYLGNGQWRSEFHIGAKWANVIRYRWLEFKRYARFFYDMPNFFTLLNINGLAVPAHATSTFYPDPNVESSTVDGYQYRYDWSGNWSDDRGHTDATVSLDSSAWSQISHLYNAWDYSYGSYQDTWFMFRDWRLFDTSSIADTHVVSATVLTLTGVEFAINDEGSDITLSGGALASNTAIVAGDWNGMTALNSPTEFASRFDIGSWDNTGANDITFNASGRSAINLTGVTTICGRASQELDGSEPAAANSYSGVHSYNADQTGTTSDPKLVVTHAAPPPEFEAMNGIDLDDIEKVNGITEAAAQAINGIKF